VRLGRHTPHPLLHARPQIAKDCAAKTPAPAKLKEFKAYMAAEGNARPDIHALRSEVEALADGFPMPGI